MGHEAFALAVCPEPLMIATLFGPIQVPASLPSDLPPFHPPNSGPHVHKRYVEHFRTEALDFYKKRAEELWPKGRLRSFCRPHHVEGRMLSGPRAFQVAVRRRERRLLGALTCSCHAAGTLADRIRPDETRVSKHGRPRAKWTHNGFRGRLRRGGRDVRFPIAAPGGRSPAAPRRFLDKRK